MSFLDIALSCIRRGWYVFPCWPKTKKPLGLVVPHGFKDASNSEAQIRDWWTRNPDANVAIACGKSGLCVVDIDHGLDGHSGAIGFLAGANIRCSYAVRTGRRPEFGVQLYFSGAIPDVGLWKLAGCEGQIKSLGGYVMAAGSVHPDSKERYEVLWDNGTLHKTPGVIERLKSETTRTNVEPGKKIAEGAGRHDALARVACGLRGRGLDKDALYAAMIPINQAMCDVPISDEDLQSMCDGIERRYPVNAPDPVVVLGGDKLAITEPSEPVDWRTHYHTADEMLNAPPVEFLIDGFLAEESIAGLAAPAGQRKSLIALNIAHALCTGEPLFGHFKVMRTPARVLYLCPEMGIRSFTDRLRKIGLLPYVGKSLYCRTMSKTGILELEQLQAEEVKDAVVILDTAIRYLKGDENSSEHMRKFASQVFRLSEIGAASVLVLHHSAKGTKESNELTLENAMRGSGELGAFVTSCWATRLQDPTEFYKSPSYLTNVKQRDFESDAFEVTGKDAEDGQRDCKLWYVEADGPVKLRPRNAFVANKDGKDDAAKSILKDNPEVRSERKMVELLAVFGIKRSREWVKKCAFDLLQEAGGNMTNATPHSP